MTESVVVLLLECMNNQPVRKRQNLRSGVRFNFIVAFTSLTKHEAPKTVALNGVASIGN